MSGEVLNQAKAQGLHWLYFNPVSPHNVALHMAVHIGGDRDNDFIFVFRLKITPRHRMAGRKPVDFYGRLYAVAKHHALALLLILKKGEHFSPAGVK